ncbi:hypothetical protein [Bradyrhizobium sp. NAS96.2]|uniref:hypothetical protein n=1 Tax=Bradyrhizobium sp. NAS96.2 TaxID=1680160 RepID=UPI001FDA3B20|nr:hypothetical protein [Bradyrhizobium sp. NAS96.2]
MPKDKVIVAYASFEASEAETFGSRVVLVDWRIASCEVDVAHPIRTIFGGRRRYPGVKNDAN